jgi:hypothetical protein
MSDADQHEPSEQLAARLQQNEGERLRTYAVVPTSGEDEGDLYAFRSMIDPSQPDPEAPPEKPRSIPIAPLALGAVALACAAALVYTIPTLMKPKPPAQYIDMGNRRFDPAGLGGRLIARWENSATYQLTIDPLEPQQLDGFRAVAANPSRPLSVVIRLKDAAGLVACQKEILLPAPQTAADAGPARALPPGKTPGGDTVQYVAGADGKLAEIALDGPLSCPEEVYRRLAGWDFSSSFPTLAGQNEWLRQENAEEEARNHARSAEWRAVVQHLSAPIEGEDVIIGDNRSRGIVDTSAGRAFVVFPSSAGSRTSEWQTFPAAIHFRCDKNGICVLSRANARTTLQARLLK